MKFHQARDGSKTRQPPGTSLHARQRARRSRRFDAIVRPSHAERSRKPRFFDRARVSVMDTDELFDQHPEDYRHALRVLCEA